MITSKNKGSSVGAGNYCSLLIAAAIFCGAFAAQAAESGLTSRMYCQNGLIAQWDGIDNAGSLTLGTQANKCRLAKGLSIRVCAGASLSLPAANTLNKCALMFDGSGGEYGKVELSSDQTCFSISVRDVFDSQDWKTLKSGVYGSSESGAEFVRDDLFSGSGRLTVRRNPFVLVVR